MAEQYNVPNVWKNGPRFWTVDWIQLPVGKELDFNGLNARWFAYPNYPPNVMELGITSGAYIPSVIERCSKMTFKKGKPVFIMDDPNGMPWVMQAGCQIVDQNLTYKDLMTQGTKLKMPTWWKYRTKVLDQDLTIQAVNGIAEVTQDDLGNSYDACFTSNNQSACSYLP
jgi:hypothetical protein